MKKNLLYIGILACATLCAACSEDELRDSNMAASPGEVHFWGAIKKQSNLSSTTRSNTTDYLDDYIILNKTNNIFGTFYIWQTIEETDKTLNYFQQYEKAEGEQGYLVVAGGETSERLNWHDKESEHTFYAWTQPNVTNETDATEQITGGVNMTLPSFGEQSSPMTTDGLSGTVIYGTNAETKLEQFIITKKGPISYDNWGQDVGLFFERPIAKIKLLGVIYIDAMGAIDMESVKECTIYFPNMVNKATFTPLSKTVLTATDKKGITWKWDKGNNDNEDNEDNEEKVADSLYVHPFKFGKSTPDDNVGTSSSTDNVGIEHDAGFFIITANVPSGENTTATKSYTGTLNSLNLSSSGESVKELKAGECMQLFLTITDGGGVGVGYSIQNWSTSGNKELPQYRIPGVYNEDDAERLLEALQKAADSPDTYTFPEGVEDLVVKTSEGGTQTETYDINLFTHIDLNSIEINITEIKIPDNCTLKGNGYNITLPNGSITGNNIENLYVNEQPYPNENGESGTNEPSGSDATGDPTT